MPYGSIVLLRGILQGMGHHVECDILARKLAKRPNAVSPVGSPAYSDCSVLTAPSDLPDGEYRVAFDGHILVVNREYGVWLAKGTPSRFDN